MEQENAVDKVSEKIRSLADSYGITEPDAVVAYGLALQLFQKPMSLQEIHANVELLLCRPLTLLTQLEIKFLLSLGKLTAKRSPHIAAKRPTRNEPCPCGSGLKYKKCCLDMINLHDLERAKNGERFDKE